MVNFLSIALAGILAATVSSTPFNHKRQDGQQVIFRSDLKQGDGQSPEFKNVLLSHTKTNVTGQYDITFVDQAEKANADRGIVESRGIPLSVGNVTLYINMGTDKANPTGPQPVTLGTTQQSAGWFYTVDGELKSASSNPQWDSWIICEGDESYPKLYWVGVVNLEVHIPASCSAVRLYADTV